MWRGEGELEGNVLEMFCWRCCFNAGLGPLAAAAFTGGTCHSVELRLGETRMLVLGFSCSHCQGLPGLGKVTSQLPQERLSREFSFGRGKERSGGGAG